MLTKRNIFVSLALLSATQVYVCAQEAPSAPVQPSMLEALNRETEGLYRQVGAGLVRVQLPKPRWMNDYAMAAVSRDRLDPDVRKRIEQVGRQSANNGMTLVVQPTNGSTTPAAKTNDPAATQPVQVDGQGTIVFVTPPSKAAADAQNQPHDAVLGGRLPMDVNTVVSFTPNNIGLLLDDDGHVLVPLYIEREAVGDSPVHVAMSDGKVVDAKFVGSDRQTNLTLLQVQKPAGKPVPLAGKKPVDGSLVMYVSTTDGSGRLGLWNGGQQDIGIIFGIDGGVAGVGRYGQFLSAASCHQIADQLIHNGVVRRATLGVIVTEVRKDDPLREKLALLGSRTAMRIDEVTPHSVADKAGLHPGDLLLAMAGEGVSDIPSLAALLASRNGATELQILRGNDVLKLSVDLNPQK